LTNNVDIGNKMN